MQRVCEEVIAADNFAFIERIRADWSPDWAAQQAAAWGKDITQPTLYLHGTDDGCHGMTQEQVDRVPQHCGPGSQSELIQGVGHFMMVQRPSDINKRILDSCTASV